jgi:hypothetical protein
MTIDTDGFLSADISTWVEKHRKENREWFELASDLNRVAHQQLALLKIPSEDSKAFTAALLFIRGLSNFQGAIDNRLSLRQPGGRLEIAPFRKSMTRAMHPEIWSMRVAEAAKRQRCIDYMLADR